MNRDDPIVGISSSARLALVIGLVLQNSLATIMGRASRTTSSSFQSSQLYNINHMIVIAELTKLLISLALELIACKSFSGLAKSIHQHILKKPADAIKGSFVPAALYFISNMMSYVALSHLSAPVFQVLIQGKLVTTAIVSAFMLNRKYVFRQWVCLALISLGVAMVVITGRENIDNKMSNGRNPTNSKVGILAVAATCIASAVGGVYFEKIVKRLPTRTQQQPSLWVRNMMLSFFSVLIGIAYGAFQDRYQQPVLQPYLYGFTSMVWFQVLLLSCGGILAAAVMKYTDNVIKGLSTGISVVVTAIVSKLFLGASISLSTVIGSGLVLVSVYFFFNQGMGASVRCSRPQRRHRQRRTLCAYLFTCICLGWWHCHYLDMVMLLPMKSPRTATSPDVTPNIDVPTSFSKSMPPTLSIRFHFRSMFDDLDCGGCTVLRTLMKAIRNFGYDVTSVGCPKVQHNDSLVIIYNEFQERCQVDSGTSSRVVHVRWILAPVGYADGTIEKVLKRYRPDDIVFNYGMNSQNTTLIPVPLTNILTLAENPYPGDGTDPEVHTFLPFQNRSGMIWTMRKGKKFHSTSYLYSSGRLPHEMMAIPATRSVDYLNVGMLERAQYFLTYDPYTFWSMIAAMLGTISIVHPVEGKTKEEWVEGFYIGAYYKAHGLPMTMPGVAYGWSWEEVEYARSTAHEMRPLLMAVNEWGATETVGRMIRDCYRHLGGERVNFEGAVLAKTFYNEAYMTE